MQGIAKAILTAILVSVCILMFINLVFFFPWYMTLVIETFNLSQAAASDNYVKEYYYYDTLDRLKDAPIFRERDDRIMITVTNNDNRSAIGYDDESYYADDSVMDSSKPYLQRGEPITVRIDAVYPLSVTLWGEEYYVDMPVYFELRSIGLKHYKDLEFY